MQSDVARLHSAAELANKAQQFGQQDDITVLSIMRRQAAVYAA